MSSSNVLVCVRVRPFAKYEIKKKERCVVAMPDSKQTKLTNPNNDNTKPFTFDHSFYSHDTSSPRFQDQEEVFANVGASVIENAFTGVNSCIFAYGQTGSGKTYTMMGAKTDPGIIPRICEGIFEKIRNDASNELTDTVEASYLEIYNEKVKDLLNPECTKLKVREHKVLGPYVENLTHHAVSTAKMIQTLIDQGNENRIVASTKMNAESSRSHAVFTLKVCRKTLDKATGFVGERTSKLSLVDLAGSERQSKTEAKGMRLVEASNINKSLTALGMVISALAKKTQKSKAHIPYRDSVLTWLLRENLGGNSQTIMICTISPAACNYDETLSSLMYADRAKQIVNRVIVNEDETARIIRVLREEVATLKMQLEQGYADDKDRRPSTVHEKNKMISEMARNEKLIEELNMSWEEKLERSSQEMKHRAEQAEAHAELTELVNDQLMEEIEKLTEANIHMAMEKEEMEQKMQALMESSSEVGSLTAASRRIKFSSGDDDNPYIDVVQGSDDSDDDGDVQGRFGNRRSTNPFDMETPRASIDNHDPFSASAAAAAAANGESSSDAMQTQMVDPRRFSDIPEDVALFAFGLSDVAPTTTTADGDPGTYARRLTALQKVLRSDPAARANIDLGFIVSTMLGNNMVDTDDIHLELTTCKGFLVKRGAVRKNWKHRWFVLDSNSQTFTYYTSDDEKHSKGEVLLETVSKAVLDRDPRGQMFNSFFVLTHDRTWRFRAPSEESAKIWCLLINMLLPGASE